MTNHEKEASEKVMQLLTTTWITQPLYVVTRLRIPDILAEEPKTVEKLSEITMSYAPFLYRIMRALACIGFFYENENRVFSITPMGEILQKEKMRSIVLMFLSEWHNRAWEKLFHSVQTGDVAFDTAFGKPCFEWFKENPEEADVFNSANQAKSSANHRAMLEVYDFSRRNSIVDIGGGYGGLLCNILNVFPRIKGIVADMPYMKEKVINQISKNGLGDRCKFCECNFFDKIPDGYDSYILSNILHDWDDINCEKILGNCNLSMPTNGILIIIESLIPDRNEFSIAKLLDIEVLVMGGGKERTEVEYRSLLNKSGFNLSRVIDTKESISILECIKQ